MQTQAAITAIGEGDFPRVIAVWEASARATHHFLTEKDIQYLKELVPEGLRQVEALLCERNGAGQVVGFIGISGESVEALFIHPDWRGKGVGRRLLTYAVETLGARMLEVNEQNDQAVGFYRHMGFEVVGRSPEDGMGLPFPLLHMRIRGEALGD